MNNFSLNPVLPVTQAELENSQEFKMTGIFSFFRKPVQNVIPCKIVTPLMIYNAIQSNFYKNATEALRTIKDKNESRKFKAYNFDYVTFSGQFYKRAENSLIAHSGFLTLDFDDIENPADLKNKCIENQSVNTVLAFISPSGKGLKLIVKIDLKMYSHREYFQAYSVFFKQQYNLTVDKSGKDVSRCCFLCYDPTAYLNPLYF